MKFAKRALLVSALGFTLSGCYTTYFNNGDVEPVKGEMQHKVKYGSDEPVNLKKECGGKDWTTVKMARSFFGWDVSVNCKA